MNAHFEMNISLSSPNNKLQSHQISFDTSSLKHFITRKTYRGRKIKSPLPQSKRCSICLEFEDHSPSPLITCSICQCTLHANCYHIPIPSSETSFTCERCSHAIQSNLPLSSFSCFICAQHDGVLIKNTSTGAYYHKTCLRLIPELYENQMNEDCICRERIRKWRYKNSCRYCQDKLSKNKAVIKCANPKCKEYYHIPCAIQKGILFSIRYLDNYYELDSYKQAVPFYCGCHNKRAAASYRSDVIYSECKDEREYHHCLNKGTKSKRKCSLNSADSEDNVSTLGNNPSTEDGQDDNCYNDFNFFFDGDEYQYGDKCDSCNNNILELNFNEMLFDNVPNEVVISPNRIMFENISPKIHMNIPFEF